MKTTLDRKFLLRIILICLFTVILGASLFVSFCYWSAIFPNNTQAIVTVVVLISLLVALLATKRLTSVLLLVLFLAYITLMAFWGAIVPYIQLLPFIISYLLVIEEKVPLIKPFLCSALLFTVLEALGFLPFIRNDFVEVGIVNLLIIGTLQATSYLIWIFILRFYSIIQHMDLLGFEEISEHTSHHFLASTLAKGLYISILLHFFNNYLNRITWGVPTEKTDTQLLKLLAESERTNQQKVYSIHDILALCRLQTTVNDDKIKQFTTSNAKTLFLLLFNIAHNYRKSGHTFEFLCKQSAPTNYLFSFTSSFGIQKELSKRIWARNLGSMKQFLKLTNKGEISVSYNDSTFTTELLYSTAHLRS